ncbi:MAG: hypothetical protein F4Z31_14970 [Gemmatimonadetes bacterium]|nr:hypothetical protein [Gemmatimonadota bacterium]
MRWRETRETARGCALLALVCVTFWAMFRCEDMYRDWQFERHCPEVTTAYLDGETSEEWIARVNYELHEVGLCAERIYRRTAGEGQWP